MAQLGGLGIKLFRCSGRLLCGRRVALRDFVHLRNSAVHLDDALALLDRSARDLGDEGVDLPSPSNDPLKRLRNAGRNTDAGLALGNRVLDFRGGFLGRVRGALRESAHLFCNHGEASSGFARAGRFHGGVEREDILKELLGHATYTHLKEYLRYAPVELKAIHGKAHPGK